MAFAYLNLTEFFCCFDSWEILYLCQKVLTILNYLFWLHTVVAARILLFFYFPISLSLCILSSIHKINIYFDIIQHVP